MDCLLLVLGQHQHELRLARQCAIHVRLALHLGDAEAGVHLDELHLHLQLVTRNHSLLEAARIDSSEEENLIRTSLAVAGGQQHEATELGHGLNLKHTGHQGPAGEVTREEVVIDSDTFVSLGRLSGVKLCDTIHQKEGVAMGQNGHDLVDVHGPRLLGGLGSVFSDDGGRAAHVLASGSARCRERSAARGAAGRKARAGHMGHASRGRCRDATILLPRSAGGLGGHRTGRLCNRAGVHDVYAEEKRKSWVMMEVRKER
mmetsp:Transcript_39379/g.85698  ORF Transcript_39379/g.85698 Transcript_39379/m.85698 type:complete len:259 (-) Transcript_39379:29-805(-)